MARNQGSGEGWITTFADLMTLMFCFFVLLTTLSTQPKNCSGLENYMKSFKNKFINYELRQTKLSCIVSLPQDFLFKSGEAALKPEAPIALTPFFKKILELPEHQEDIVVIEGHSDNVPIKTKKFKNNWELSSARATNIATMLIEKMKYNPKTISVRGFAETRPRVPYKDQSGKSLMGEELRRARKINRRVEVILTPSTQSKDVGNILFDGKK